MVILITGVAGFIGSHLSESLLKYGNKVIGIDNFDSFYSKEEKRRNLDISLKSKNFSFIEGDLGNKAVLQSIPINVDIVVHLAAKAGVLPSLKDPRGYISTNIEGTNTILEWMKEKKIKKLVFASSSSVYGNNSKIPFDETDDVNEPISPYAFSKRSCELMNYTYHKLYGLDIINLRFFTVYGERQRPDLAIRKFINNIYSGLPITIYGDGSTARDYTYFADTVSGIVSAIDFIKQNERIFEIINLGNNNPVKLITLINKIGNAAGLEPSLIYEDFKPGDVDITYANIEKAKKLLGYNPKISLEEGLVNFITWYKNHYYTAFAK